MSSLIAYCRRLLAVPLHNFFGYLVCLAMHQPPLFWPCLWPPTLSSPFSVSEYTERLNFEAYFLPTRAALRASASIFQSLPHPKILMLVQLHGHDFCHIGWLNISWYHGEHQNHPLLFIACCLLPASIGLCWTGHCCVLQGEY